MIERIDGIVGAFDSFRVEEAYNWRDDIMEITRRIVHETDEARLNNIAEHFKVDLSEIREFLEKKRQKLNPQTNADRIRAMTDEELANEIIKIVAFCAPGHRPSPDCCCNCQQCWVEWLRRPTAEGETC